MVKDFSDRHHKAKWLASKTTKIEIVYRLPSETTAYGTSLRPLCRRIDYRLDLLDRKSGNSDAHACSKELALGFREC
ncbi:hypothetical protein DF051_26895 [Burkholderia contaminans]|uniref:Uncharacterized protein n=1 Tax=Burkholderia contaminans TaxID=488447 RepID=A0A3N8PH56_9BURK|nr:hypothetical protein CFB43_15595 [Burkholderia sp. AU15512]RQT10688.1 hypothetical protein DF051_26895 [Burkholderia contaminans]